MQVFVDITAFEAIICKEHPCHSIASNFLKTSVARNFQLVSSQQLLFALADRLRNQPFTKSAPQIISALRQSQLIHFEPLTEKDLMESWRLFDSFEDSWWTFYRCASMALMNRKEMGSVFGFDVQFMKYGFRLLPGVKPE